MTNMHGRMFSLSRGITSVVNPNRRVSSSVCSDGPARVL